MNILDLRKSLAEIETQLTGTPLPPTVNGEENKAQYEKHMSLLDDKAWHEDVIEHFMRIAKRIWEKSNVGDTFAECTFESYETEGTNLAHAKSQCERYINSFTEDTGSGLLLYGDYGVGKTHLVTAVANYLVYNYGVSAYFTTTPDLMAQIQKSEKSFMKDEFDIKKTVREIDILILDDLGREKSNDPNQQTIFSLVDARYRAKKPMLITSNLTPHQLSYQVGDATMSRLVNMCTYVEMRGTDYRTAHRQSFEEVTHPVPF